MNPALLVLVLSAITHLGKCESQHGERLIGWKGETYIPEKVVENREWIQSLSWQPRAFFYHNLLTEREISHVINLAAPYMKKSRVIGNGTGNFNPGRSSLGTFLWRMQDSVIAGIQEKVAKWIGAPTDHQEMMQVKAFH